MSVATLSVTEITVERPTITQDGLGGRIETWAEIWTGMARVQPIGGSEGFRYAREESVFTHNVYVSGKPDIRVEDRISTTDDVDGTAVMDSTRHLHIQAILNRDLLSRHIKLMCEERDDG